MDKSELIERLHSLEKEVHLLKNELESPRKKSKYRSVLTKGYKVIVSNWVLLSFLAALITAVYVKFAFDLDYFEQYRNQSTTKKLAEFYRRLGNEMMSANEYEAAAEAYQSALELRNNDVESALSLAKARVFVPLKDKKMVAPQIVDNRLRQLLSLFPDDEQLLLMKGSREWEKGDYSKGVELTKKALKLKPNLAAAHIQLGYFAQWTSNIEEAMTNYQRALQIDPENVIALNNLGFCRKITMNFDEAIELLRKSNYAASSLLTSLNLGDAYRFKEDIEAAISTHEFAKGVMENGQIKQEDLQDARFVSGRWIVNYMPLGKGDLETIKNAVRVDTVENMKSFLYYSLSFDYSINQDFSKADGAFSSAIKLDPNRTYNGYVLNQIQFMENCLRLSGQTRAWLNKKKRVLNENKQES